MTTSIVRSLARSCALALVGLAWGVGPGVEESGANLIPGFAYSAPFEDLKLKK